MQHFADRLNQACDAAGAPVCVGIDPVLERLPSCLTGSPTDRLAAFGVGIIEAVAGVVPAVKPQLACFERYGSAGWAAYEKVLYAAQQNNLIVIADAKRGDIGTSAAHYAAGLLAGETADALTVNTYLGADSLEPFIEVAQSQGKGLFALVRTSNPGGDALQTLALQDGRTVSEAVADMIAQQGSSHVGASGYSLLGAVVGATKPADAGALRQRMPQQIFLVPGFGAQGGTAEDVKACFDEQGRGALITASRSVIYAFRDQPGERWTKAVARAAEDLNQQIAAILA